MKVRGRSDELLQLAAINQDNQDELLVHVEKGLSVLWFREDHNDITIDGVEYHFHKNQIIFLTEFHKLEITSIRSINYLKFNRAFFCILDHDSEVGCQGLLFFGASKVPIISIPESEIMMMELFWQSFNQEMKAKDNLQIEMLQMMLKRYLILCTRFYKEQHEDDYSEISHHDTIRSFNFLVEKHFRTKHTVKEYADLMNKSPKTLSNLFAKASNKTPLQYIQERKLIEARRGLVHSDKAVSEIAYEIGFEDVQSFSRFFKKKQGVSPTAYREATID